MSVLTERVEKIISDIKIEQLELDGEIDKINTEITVLNGKKNIVKVKIIGK